MTPIATQAGPQIARSALPQEKIPFGPWRGSMRSVPADRVPRDYAAGGTNFLYRPTHGAWLRRGGQTQKFDTYGAAVGLLPAKWGARCRDLQELVSDNFTDNLPSIIALLTKETVSAGLDDGKFSTVWWRDQVNNENMRLGGDYSALTYPVPGTEPTYKVVPLWYDSGDGGMTRGITEFQQRFFGSGSRRMVKVGDWRYLPSLHGTPSRSTDSAASRAQQEINPTSVEENNAWVDQDGAGGTSPYAALPPAVADDSNATYIKHAMNGGTVEFVLENGVDPSTTVGHVLTVITKNTKDYNANYHLGITFLASDDTPIITTANRKNVGGTTGSEWSPALGIGTDWTTYTLTLNATEVGVLQAKGYAGTKFSVAFYTAVDAEKYVYVAYVGLAVPGALSTSTMRLMPSGPIPPCHPGTLACGPKQTTSILPMLPTSTDTVGSWETEDAGSDLHDHIDIAPPETGYSYIKQTGSAGNACKVKLAAPTNEPPPDDLVEIVCILTDVALTSTHNNRVQLMQGTTEIAVLTATLPGSVPHPGYAFRQRYSYALTQAQISAITDWTNLYLRIDADDPDDTAIQVYYAALEHTPTLPGSEGGWKGSDRYYHSVAYRAWDDSIWAPCIPRGKNATLPSGFGLFTVNEGDPTADFQSVLWSNIPIGPYGTKSRILLRTPKVDSERQSILALDPTDLRVVWEIKDNTTTTYTDYYSDDDSLTLDVDGLFIKDDLIMPPRARFAFAGVSRLCHAYGGLNPCAIEFVPVAHTSETTYDLNVDDETAALYGSSNSFYYKISNSNGGAAASLLLYHDTGAALSSPTTITLTSKTLEEVVDQINATAVSGDAKMWRAQVLPGANPQARADLYLTPTLRTITSCVVSGQAITKSGGGLAKIPVGSFIDGADVTAGAYVSAIVSDTELTFVGTITAATKDLDFVSATGDTPTGGGAYDGYVRAIANSLPSFLYFNKTYLDQFPIEKDAIWMTTASPGSSKCAANLFSGKSTNKFKPPSADAGISMGGYACDNGFVVPFANKSAAIRNTRDAGTGIDQDYHLFIVNEGRGCCAWDSVAGGTRCGVFASPEGIIAADLFDEVKISRYTYTHAPVPFGDFSYEMPLCIAATAKDDDTARLTARIIRGAVWVNYRSDAGEPDRQVIYDFSAGGESSGLRAMRRPDGDLWGWSLPLVRTATCMCEARRADGAHIYAWDDSNAGTLGDGRVDEIEDTTEKDNGVEIAGSVSGAWESDDSSDNLSAQEITTWHATPTGATVQLKYHRSLADDAYSLTPSTSAAVVIEDLKMLTLPARAPTGACYLEWLQTAGSASELRRWELRAKRLRKYK